MGNGQAKYCILLRNNQNVEEPYLGHSQQGKQLPGPEGLTQKGLY
jgi:hypothetical protein